MLKKFNHTLLTRYPLLWNTKITFLLPALLLVNFIFFCVGLANGAISFYETDNHYRYDDDFTGLAFGWLLSLLSLIVWLAFYFRNNGFKAVYPRSRYSLFGEWLLVLVGSYLICGNTMSYYLGKDIRHRLYFSREETERRCNIITMASYFYDGSFDRPDYESVTGEDGNEKSVAVTHFDYKGCTYDINSLMNKNTKDFTIISWDKDSLNTYRIREWLRHNERDSVQHVLAQFLQIASEHNLSGNIDARKWTDLVYNYPEFNEYKIIGKEKKDGEVAGPMTDDETSVPYTEVDMPVDTTNQYVVMKGKEKLIYNKYYVPADQLEHGYNIISDSYTRPSANPAMFAIISYVAFILSFLIFSFRMTSIRDWFIALIAFFVITIIIGVTVATAPRYVGVSIGIVLLLLLYAYPLILIYKSRKKRLGGVILNLVLWTLPGFLFAIYATCLAILKKLNGFDIYLYNATIAKKEAFPITYFLDESGFSAGIASLLFAVLYCFMLTHIIRKWKSLAEN